jgi:hypothetical protein
MNDSQFSSEQDHSREAKRDQPCKQMGQSFPVVCAHHDAAKLLARFKAAM